MSYHIFRFRGSYDDAYYRVSVGSEEAAKAIVIKMDELHPGFHHMAISGVFFGEEVSNEQ